MPKRDWNLALKSIAFGTKLYMVFQQFTICFDKIVNFSLTIVTEGENSRFVWILFRLVTLSLASCVVFVLSKQCSCQNSQTATQVALGRRLWPFLVRFLKNLDLSSTLSCFKVSVSTSTWSSTLRLKELTVSVIFLANFCFLCLVFGVKSAALVALFVGV